MKRFITFLISELLLIHGVAFGQHLLSLESSNTGNGQNFSHEILGVRGYGAAYRSGKTMEGFAATAPHFNSGGGIIGKVELFSKDGRRGQNLLPSSATVTPSGGSFGISAVSMVGYYAGNAEEDLIFVGNQNGPSGSGSTVYSGNIQVYKKDTSSNWVNDQNLTLYPDDLTSLTDCAGLNGPAAHFGATMVAGDFTGDGLDDLAIGAPGAGTNGEGMVLLMPTLPAGGFANSGTADEPRCLKGEAFGDKFGQTLAIGLDPSDTSSNPKTALLIAAPNNDAPVQSFSCSPGATNAGRVYSVKKSMGSPLQSTISYRKIKGEGCNEHIGSDGLASLDTDGNPANGSEIITASRFASSGAGKVLKYMNDPTLGWTASDVMVGATGEGLGASIAVDAADYSPGNGRMPRVFIGSPNAGNGAGKVYVRNLATSHISPAVHTEWDTDIDAASQAAYSNPGGQSLFYNFGQEVAAVGEIGGENRVAVGAPGNNTSLNHPGRAFLDLNYHRTVCSPNAAGDYEQVSVGNAIKGRNLEVKVSNLLPNQKVLVVADIFGGAAAMQGASIPLDLHMPLQFPPIGLDIRFQTRAPTITGCDHSVDVHGYTHWPSPFGQIGGRLEAMLDGLYVWSGYGTADANGDYLWNSMVVPNVPAATNFPLWIKVFTIESGPAPFGIAELLTSLGTTVNMGRTLIYSGPAIIQDPPS